MSHLVCGHVFFFFFFFFFTVASSPWAQWRHKYFFFFPYFLVYSLHWPLQSQLCSPRDLCQLNASPLSSFTSIFWDGIEQRALSQGPWVIYFWYLLISAGRRVVQYTAGSIGKTWPTMFIRIYPLLRGKKGIFDVSLYLTIRLVKKTHSLTFMETAIWDQKVVVYMLKTNLALSVWHIAVICQFKL